MARNNETTEIVKTTTTLGITVTEGDCNKPSLHAITHVKFGGLFQQLGIKMVKFCTQLPHTHLFVHIFVQQVPA